MSMHHKLLVLCSGHFLTAPYPPALAVAASDDPLRALEFVARHLNERDHGTPTEIAHRIDCAARATFTYMSSHL